VPSEQVNDPSIKGLHKCFDPQCDKNLDLGSCDGVVGCYWCVRDKYDAPLDEEYCADINKCYGGKEGKIASFVARTSVITYDTIFRYYSNCLLPNPPKMCLKDMCTATENYRC